MYRVHLAGVTDKPELMYATDQLLIVVWLDLPSQKFLEFMPQIFYWIEIWRLRRGLPPVDVGVEKLNRPLRSVLRIIVLHEAMTMWVHVMQERQQCLLQDLHVAVRP